jgi:hypothetical protein
LYLFYRIERERLKILFLDLKFVDLTENQIDLIPDEAGELINLEQFYLSKNNLKDFPFLKNCCQLKVSITLVILKLYFY